MPSTSQPLTALDIVVIFWRHKGKMALWCCFIFVLAAAAWVYWPRSYASRAKVYLRMGRESVSLDPSATISKTVEIQDTREHQVLSTRDMLLSRNLLDYVVDQLGPDAILNDAKQDDQNHSVFGKIVDNLAALRLAPAVSPREQAVTKLAKSIRVDVSRNSSVLEVAFLAGNAKLAQQILELFLDEFQRQYVAANRTVGSLEFFTDQSLELKRRVDEANTALRDAKNRGSLVSVVAEQKAVQQQLGAVETEMLASEAAAKSARAAIDNYREILASVPEKYDLATTNGFANGAADNMRQEFYKMQIDLWGLETKLGKEHPLVVAASEQLRHSEAILDEQPLERVQTTSGVNPVYQTIDLELRREEVKLAAVEVKANTLKEQYAALRGRVRDLNGSEIQLAELERDAKIAAETYRNYVDYQEQARIAHELAASHISNLNVVQRPTLVEKPENPKAILLFGAAFMIGMLGSVMIAFLAELVRQLRAAQLAAEARKSPVDWAIVPKEPSGEELERKALARAN